MTGKGKLLTEMNFKTSSIKSTGALKDSTAAHSVQFRGVIANKVYQTCISVNRGRNVVFQGSDLR